MERCEKRWPPTTVQNVERLLTHSPALVTGPACDPTLGNLGHPRPDPWETPWRGTYFFVLFCFMDLAAASQGTMVMGTIEMRETDFYWLVSSFQVPLPPLLSADRRAGGRVPVKVNGAKDVKSHFFPSFSLLPSSLPLPIAIVFKPSNYSNSNNNHHLLGLFF